MTPSSRDTALSAIKEALEEIRDLEDDGSISGRSRMCVARIKQRLTSIASLIREETAVEAEIVIPAKKDPSAHLGGVSDIQRCGEIGNGE